MDKTIQDIILEIWEVSDQNKEKYIESCRKDHQFGTQVDDALDIDYKHYEKLLDLLNPKRKIRWLYLLRKPYNDTFDLIHQDYWKTNLYNWILRLDLLQKLPPSILIKEHLTFSEVFLKQDDYSYNLESSLSSAPIIGDLVNYISFLKIIKKIRQDVDDTNYILTVAHKDFGTVFQGPKLPDKIIPEDLEKYFSERKKSNLNLIEQDPFIDASTKNQFTYNDLFIDIATGEKVKQIFEEYGCTESETWIGQTKKKTELLAALHALSPLLKADRTKTQWATAFYKEFGLKVAKNKQGDIDPRSLRGQPNPELIKKYQTYFSPLLTKPDIK